MCAGHFDEFWIGTCTAQNLNKRGGAKTCVHIHKGTVLSVVWLVLGTAFCIEMPA